MELLNGFLVILTPITLSLIILGVLVGIIFGAIPGLSAFTALALTLPLTFGMEPINGISFLMAIYVGGVSGGVISAILLKIPGTPSSIATCFDGIPMAENGEAGKALGVGIFFSFVGGIFSALVLTFAGPSLAKVALKFSPYEYVGVILFSLTTVASLSSGNMLKGLISGLFGICLSFVGMDMLTPYSRFTFGVQQLGNGFNLVPLMIGVFAVSQILEVSATSKKEDISCAPPIVEIKGFGFTFKEFVGQIKNATYSALIGLGVGILPGIGGNVSNIMAYAFVKKRSKYPEKFGTGIIDGIVASETSNNAAVGGALIILMVLGIPGDNATSMVLGGFQIHGITPGPLLFTTSAPLVNAVFAAFILSNIVMLVSEYLGLKFFTKILSVPKTLLLPIVIAFCFVGAFSANNNVFNVLIMIIFGVVAYILKGLDFPLSPLVVSFILAPLFEVNLRRSLMRSSGSLMPIIKSPIAMFFIILTVIIVIFTIINERKTNALTASIDKKN